MGRSGVFLSALSCFIIVFTDKLALILFILFMLYMFGLSVRL